MNDEWRLQCKSYLLKYEWWGTLNVQKTNCIIDLTFVIKYIKQFETYL